MQQWVAARLGISESHLTRLLNGHKAVDDELAGRMAALLGVTAGEVLAASKASQIAHHTARLTELGIAVPAPEREAVHA